MGIMWRNRFTLQLRPSLPGCKRCDCNVDRVGRQHVTTTTCDTELKTARGLLPMGLIIGYQTDSELMGMSAADGEYF